MINNTTLTGRLTKDVELKHTQSGKAVANFTIAVERNFKDAQGNKITDFINCIAWNKTAETIAQYFHKGNLIGIVGEIQTRNYENQQGQRVYVTEVNVNNFTFLESKQDNIQAQTQAPAPDPFAENTNNVSVSDSDLPF